MRVRKRKKEQVRRERRRKLREDIGSVMKIDGGRKGARTFRKDEQSIRQGRERWRV